MLSSSLVDGMQESRSKDLSSQDIHNTMADTVLAIKTALYAQESAHTHRDTQTHTCTRAKSYKEHKVKSTALVLHGNPVSRHPHCDQSIRDVSPLDNLQSTKQRKESGAAMVQGLPLTKHPLSRTAVNHDRHAREALQLGPAKAKDLP